MRRLPWLRQDCARLSYPGQSQVAHVAPLAHGELVEPPGCTRQFLYPLILSLSKDAGWFDKLTMSGVFTEQGIYSDKQGIYFDNEN